jgi:hypothetical protein
MYEVNWIFSHISWTFMLCSIVALWWWISLQQNTQRLSVAAETTYDNGSVRRIRTAKMMIFASQSCLVASLVFAVLHVAL